MGIEAGPGCLHHSYPFSAQSTFVLFSLPRTAPSEKHSHHFLPFPASQPHLHLQSGIHGCQASIPCNNAKSEDTFYEKAFFLLERGFQCVFVLRLFVPRVIAFLETAHHRRAIWECGGYLSGYAATSAPVLYQNRIQLSVPYCFTQNCCVIAFGTLFWLFPVKKGNVEIREHSKKSKQNYQEARTTFLQKHAETFGFLLFMETLLI